MKTLLHLAEVQGDQQIQQSYIFRHSKSQFALPLTTSEHLQNSSSNLTSFADVLATSEPLEWVGLPLDRRMSVCLISFPPSLGFVILLNHPPVANPHRFYS